TGHRWTADVDGAVSRLVLDFARRWQRDAIAIPNTAHKDAVLKAACRLERRDGLTNLLALACDLKPIADAGTTWDRDPWLLGVPNGVVDLRPGALRPGRRTDAVTITTAVPFDADASCPRWTQFIAEIFPADLDLMSFVARAVGYSLT